MLYVLPPKDVTVTVPIPPAGDKDIPAPATNCVTPPLPAIAAYEAVAAYDALKAGLALLYTEPVT